MLNINFWTVPHITTQIVTRKELQKIYKNHGEFIIACGVMWNIKHKNLGVSVYSVYLEKRN